MKSVLLAVGGFIAGYFLGSFLLRSLFILGFNMSALPLIFKLFPYFSGILLACLLPLIDSGRKKRSGD
ncbi:DUF5957 family protein [Bacillus horti]|uniref:Uncharacterized protein n=1 Tax=Caldalkalibacillus horti TaxID=77523 RepID=A0ABT9VYZ8_9BACI|nr:DUF5957 family protein [Bacillus horti]MDQ0166223.1 hypothetical protein [Bacillus horti]